MPLSPLDGGVPVILDRPRRLIWNYRALRAVCETVGSDIRRLDNPFIAMTEDRLVALLYGMLLTEDRSITAEDAYRLIVEHDAPLEVLELMVEAWNITMPKRKVTLPKFPGENGNQAEQPEATPDPPETPDATSSGSSSEPAAATTSG